jgi:hypothetical protein
MKPNSDVEIAPYAADLRSADPAKKFQAHIDMAIDFIRRYPEPWSFAESIITMSAARREYRAALADQKQRVH